MPANEIRIIGGEWRSRRIRFSQRAQLRPTPDRVRETLFNWLGQDLTGRTCLDVFAGSGALGFEAASRGASRVVMVERDREAYAALASNRDVLGASWVELARTDALEFVRHDRSQYDVIFLDPPYASDLAARVLPLLPARMAPDAWLYHEAASRLEWPAGWTVCKQGKAGQVIYQLVKRTQHEPHGDLPRNVRPDNAGS